MGKWSKKAKERQAARMKAYWEGKRQADSKPYLTDLRGIEETIVERLKGVIQQLLDVIKIVG